MAIQKNVPNGRQEYQSFTGDYGDVHPRNAPEGTFHGVNVIVYDDGTIGPRNGLVEQPLTGATYVNGALNAFFFGVEHDVATPRMVYSQDVTPAYFEVDDMAPQTPGRFTGPAGTPDPFVFDSEPSNGKLGVLPRLGFNTFLSTLGDTTSGTYLLDNLSDEITPIANTYGAHDIIEYVDQLFLFGIGTGADGRGHKLQYSAPEDPDTFPEENIARIGFAWVIFRAAQFQNGLLVVTQDQSFWLMTGSVEEGTVRRVWHGDGPQIGNPYALVVDQEAAVFLSTGAPGGSYPKVFNGSEVDDQTLKHLRGWMTDANAIAVLCEPDHDLLFVDNDARALMRHNGVWTRHQFEVPVGEWAAPYEDQRFYLVKDGDETHKPVFYRSTFQTGVRPPIADDQFQSPGDGSKVPIDAWFELPELWQEDGSMHRPMHLLVEFTSYDTGAEGDSPVDPHFEVEVDIIDRFVPVGEGVQTVSAGTWDEADGVTPSTTDGVRRRFIARSIPATAPGAGLQVRVKDIRGVKIERIVLDFELTGSLDRA